jgi:hypothetical protein
MPTSNKHYAKVWTSEFLDTRPLTKEKKALSILNKKYQIRLPYVLEVDIYTIYLHC